MSRRLTRFVSYALLAIAVLASEEAQTPLLSSFPRLRYVDCKSVSWSARVLDCGQLEVPLDWNNPRIGSLTLNYTALPVKRRAPRKGTVFLHLGHEYLGRFSNPESALHTLFSQDIQFGTILSEYDLVMWTSRESYISERMECFPEDDEDFRYTTNPYAHSEDAMIAFYNTTYRDDLRRDPPWDEDMAWLQTQTPEDVRDMLHAQEKLVTHCLEASSDRDIFKYGGTAASARDLAALADALDGPGSPINLWTKHHGSVLASHLLKMFPERVGKIVLDDPIDPNMYQEQAAHKRWSVDIATANNTLARIQQREMESGSLGYMQFYGRPLVDEICFGQIVKFLHTELVGWHTCPEAEYQEFVTKQEYDVLLNPQNIADREFSMFGIGFIRQSTGINGWRSSGAAWTARALGGMPLVCNDAFDHGDVNKESVHVEVEASLIRSIHSAPLIANGAFPPLRYLCHLWPIRAVERVSLRGTEELDLDGKVLILLHKRDYWNYFSVSESVVHERWPTAEVVGGLRYGDLTLDHDQCSLDIVKAFYSTDTPPPVRSYTCKYDDEVL